MITNRFTSQMISKCGGNNKSGTQGTASRIFRWTDALQHYINLFYLIEKLIVINDDMIYGSVLK